MVIRLDTAKMGICVPLRNSVFSYVSKVNVGMR